MLGYLVKDAVSSMFWFFTYRFTLLPVIIVNIFFFLFTHYLKSRLSIQMSRIIISLCG